MKKLLIGLTLLASATSFAGTIEKACNSYGVNIYDINCEISARLVQKKGVEFAMKQCKEQFNSERVKEVANALSKTNITTVSLNLDASFLSDNDDIDIGSLTRAQTDLVDLITKTELGYSACVRGVNVGASL